MPELDIERYFYGSATLGERGQVVIPAEARKDCDIQPGDKVLVFRHPLHPHMLILAKISEMQSLLQQLGRTLEQAAERMAETIPPDEG
jgi:AbrB family looped-hinge helix DNA binding protein